MPGLPGLDGLRREGDRPTRLGSDDGRNQQKLPPQITRLPTKAAAQVGIIRIKPDKYIELKVYPP